jgi:hypothetical protein
MPPLQNFHNFAGAAELKFRSNARRQTLARLLMRGPAEKLARTSHDTRPEHRRRNNQHINEPRGLQ